MRLPPDYRTEGGSAEGPSFYATTAHAVKNKMENNGRARRHSNASYFYCIYCQFDPSLRGFHVDRQWHPEHLVEIDHIFPFAAILRAPMLHYPLTEYLRLTEEGQLPPIAASHPEGWDARDPVHQALLYNDVDNLHVICSGHKRDRRDLVNYLGLLPQQILKMYPAR